MSLLVQCYPLIYVSFIKVVSVSSFVISLFIVLLFYMLFWCPADDKDAYMYGRISSVDDNDIVLPSDCYVINYH